MSSTSSTPLSSASAHWMTASQIATRYIVGESRLLSYSQRGNLPIRRGDDGTVYFDERMVARFFQARPGAGIITTMRAPETPCMGVLGVAKLGDGVAPRTMPSLSGRDARRRAVRLSPSQSSQDVAVRERATRTA